MSYKDSNLILDSGQIALDATVDGLASFTPGTHPYTLRRVTIIVTEATTSTTADVDIKRRPTAGSTSGEVTIDRVSVPVSSQGVGFFTPALDTEIAPGEELVVEVVNAASAGDGHVIYELEPRWEEPENESNLTLTA